MEDGFTDGADMRTMVDRVNNELDLKDLKGITKNGTKFVIPSSVRSPAIIRSETTKVASNGALKNYADNDIEEVRYLAVLDNRTSPFCRNMNGNAMTLKQAENIIPAHSNCRSTWTAITKLGG